METDESYALILFACLLMLLSQDDINTSVVKFLLQLTRPVTTAILGLALFVVIKYGLHYTFLLLLVISVYLLQKIWTNDVTYDSSVQYDIGRDQSRFNPSTSLDLQLATGSIKPPISLNQYVGSTSNLLIYPPSFETLKELSG
jgi:hypothetical protein